MEEIKGYKAFNKDSTNRYGKPFEIGKTYRVEGKISFGNSGNGYHMCTFLCDVFRYVNAIDDEVLVAVVTGRGKKQKMDDEYYGYYDMYSVEEITIDRFLERSEIIDLMLKSSSHQVIKFLTTFSLNENEKKQFFLEFMENSNVLKNLLYYQYGCKNVFDLKEKSNDYQMKLVMKNGQNNS